jgi:hypothetical protein
MIPGKNSITYWKLFELQISEPMPEQKKVRPFDVHPIET